MSRKRADPRSTPGGQRRAAAAAGSSRRDPRPAPAAPGRARSLAVLGVLGIALALGSVVFLSGRASRPTSASGGSPSIPAEVSPSAAGSALVGGGPLAQKLVAVLHADPFRSHIDETTVARSTAGTVTVNVTAKAVGDVSGQDVALDVTSTGAGDAIDQEVVSLGGTTWIRRTGATTWEVHRRSEASGSIYGLLYPFNAGSHYDLISRLLSIVVLGGMGSVGGAVIAAMIVSTSSAIVASTVSPVWSEMTFFVILILVLLVRPQGLFGTVGRGAI